MEFDSLTKQQKNGLRETVIRKTHQQRCAILQPCKFFKVFDYREWAESFVDFVDSKAQHNLAEDLRLTLKNLDPNAMIYEPALAPAARIWTVVLASAAILVSKNSSATEKKT